ncbi:MAG: hypothetical protein CMJ83_08465 [Planctomycetes bacterium]|nr:hypothetical protein [Planctomycetota bacterium]
MPETFPSDEEIEALIDPEVLEEIGDPVPIPLAATVVYIPVLLLGLVLAIFWQDTFPGEHVHGTRLATDVGIGLLVGLGLVTVTWLLVRMLGSLQELEVEFRKVLGPLPLSQILLLALLSGVAEELMFRGAMQPWLGWVATSLIFGGLHFVPSTTFLPWTMFAIGAGFLFGWLFDERQSLIAPMVAHVVVNAINLYLIVNGKRAPITPRELA